MADTPEKIWAIHAHDGRLIGVNKGPVSGWAEYVRADVAEPLSRTGAVKVTRTDILREWFGGERYARDYEYLDANYGRQADQVVAFLFALEPPAPEGQQPVAVIVGHHADHGYRIEWLDSSAPVGTKLYTRPSEQAVTEAMKLARAVLAQSITAGHNVPGPTPEDIEKAFWALDATLKAAMEAGRHD